MDNAAIPYVAYAAALVLVAFVFAIVTNSLLWPFMSAAGICYGFTAAKVAERVRGRVR
jgi:hypothetical protein